MTNLDSIFKSRDITLPTMVHLVKAMVFPVVMYGYECWTVKKAVSQSVQSLSRVQVFATPCITACQASLFITISWSSLRLLSIESVMPSSHLILGRPFLLLPPIPPSIRVFSKLQQSKQSCTGRKNNRNIDQCNTLESPDMNPCTYGQLVYNKGGNITQLMKDNLFNMILG